MNKVIIMIPKAYNNGNQIEQEKINTIQEKIINITGGLSVSECQGYWQDGNKLYKDNNYKMETLFQDISLIAELKQLASSIKQSLQQESIFFEVSKSDVSFI